MPDPSPYTTRDGPAAAAVFPGASEMAARCRAFDWAATPLGPVAGWPPSLRTAAGLVLGAGFPMILLWGPALVQLYNDGYVPFLAAKHPGGLGRPTRHVWPEVWHLNAPIYARVLGGETVTLDEAHFPVRRQGPDGPAEDLYITLAYSPVPDDAGGPHGPSVGGVLVTLRDVTAEVAGRRAEAERARLAAALAAERTTLLDEVFRRAPSFLHVLRGPDFIFELANEAYYTLVGRRDLLGRPAFEALPEVAAGDFPARLAQVMATGVPFVGRELPVTLARTPGAPLEERVVDLVYLPLLDGDGACTRVLGHGVDVTDYVRARRRTEATLAARTAAVEAGLTALAASEARFRAVQDTSPTGFAIQRPVYDGMNADVTDRGDGLVDAGDAVPAARRVVDFTMTYVNAAGAGMFGRAADAGVGQRLLTLFPELAALGLVDAYAGVLDTGVPYQTELRHHDAAGRELGVALTAVRIGTGADAEVAVSFADVTGRLRAEAERARLLEALGAERERLRALILEMPAPLALVEGPAHRFALVNDAYRQVSGPRPEVTGRTLREAFPELSGQGLYEQFDRVYATGVAWAAPEQLVRYDRTGTGVEDTWWDLRLEPVRDADAAVDGGLAPVVGILNYNVDVTAQVRARREVEALLAASEAARADADAARREAEAARTEAETANRAKAEFLATMSHELRTPLNAIGGYAELIAMGIRGPVVAQQIEDLRRIQASQRHLLGLVNEVLNYARIETGTVRYDLSDVPLAAAVAAVEPLVAPQLAAKGLAYHHDGCGDTPLAARADAEKLRQVLLNLVSNAIKFTERGGRVEVACAAAGDRVAVQVRDTGIGIPADQLERIFEPFVQVHATLTRTHEGTGLGLAISRDLARGMGGDLTAESTPGVGSMFTLTLPAA